MKLPLFAFPPGARGDFLSSILYGDVLEESWQRPMVDRGGTHYENCEKIHNFGFSSYGKLYVTSDNLDQWNSYWIRVNTAKDMWNVAWLNYSKHPQDEEPSQSVVYARYSLTKMINQEFEWCQDWFDHIVDFENLWDLNFLHAFYQQTNNKELNTDQLERIQHNININLELIKQNPFEFVDTP